MFIGTLLHVFSVLCICRIGHRFKIFYVLPSVATNLVRGAVVTIGFPYQGGSVQRGEGAAAEGAHGIAPFNPVMGVTTLQAQFLYGLLLPIGKPLLDQ